MVLSYPDSSTNAKFRGRSVTRGFQQLERIDYDEIFVPSARFPLSSCFLQLFPRIVLHSTRRMSNCILNGNLREDKAMDQSEGSIECGLLTMFASN